MGTRGLIAVFSDGEYKVANYGQWDHYPSGQGVDVLNFCKEHLATFVGRDIFKEKLKNTRFIDDKEHTALWKKEVGVDLDSNNGFVSIDKSEEFGEKFPSLHRDTGSDILSIILSSTKEVLLTDSLSFVSNSIFCEWAYVIDLDKLQLEVYTGFNTTHPPDEGSRFYGMEGTKGHDGTQYYPVRLVVAYPFSSLPTPQQFEDDCRDSTEDD